MKRFLPFSCGTPSHDHLGDVFAALDAEKFQHCLTAWVAAWTSERTVVIAIDGKTVRRSGKKGSHDAIHVVSAFAARQRLVLGQVKVVRKSNEIIAIPKLLEMLDIESAIVSVYAMGCQRDITLNIIDKGVDYLLALKGNQGTLREDTKVFANEQKFHNFNDTSVSQHQTIDGGHGRIETRTTTVFQVTAWLQERHNWSVLKAVVMVESLREI